MRRHKGLLFAIAVFAAVLLVATAVGRRQRGRIDEDFRASTYVTGPSGASALFEALSALHVQTVRLRSRLLPSATGAGEAMVLLEPVRGLLPNEERTLLEYNAGASGGDLVVASGLRSDALLRCFGYARSWLILDSTSVVFGAEIPRRPFFSHAVLEPAVDRPEPPSPFRTPATACKVGTVTRVDTLVNSPRGPVVLAVRRTGAAHDAILVADVSLFRNRALRSSAAGPYVLSLLAARYKRVAFDEYHQGYGGSGSLGRALLEWSARSPVGWGVWQAALVGVLALFASGIRFGRPRARDERTRRSSGEHVRALATALAATKGHDVAVDVLVRGLRRRLGRERGTRTTDQGTTAGAKPQSEWLADIARRPLSPPVRKAVTSLERLTTPGQNEAAVLAAANAVEDVWDGLRHSTSRSWRA